MIKCSAALLSGALYTVLSLLKEYVLQNTIHQIEDTSIRLSAAPAHFADRAAIIRSWIQDDPDPRLQLIADPAHCRSGSSF